MVWNRSYVNRLQNFNFFYKFNLIYTFVKFSKKKEVREKTNIFLKVKGRRLHHYYLLNYIFYFQKFNLNIKKFINFLKTEFNLSSAAPFVLLKCLRNFKRSSFFYFSIKIKNKKLWEGCGSPFGNYIQFFSIKKGFVVRQSNEIPNLVNSSKSLEISKLVSSLNRGEALYPVILQSIVEYYKVSVLILLNVVLKV